MNKEFTSQKVSWKMNVCKIVSMVLVVSMVLSCMTTAVFAATTANTPSIWRVLWLICKNTDQEVTKNIRAKGSLSDEDIDKAYQLIPYFESFIESATNGAVDVQITPVISDYPANWFCAEYEGNVGQDGYDLFHDNQIFLKEPHGTLLFDVEKKPLYDSVVVFAGLANNQCDSYAGLTHEWLSFIPINDDAWWFQDTLDLANLDDYAQMIFLERVMIAIHEQLHYLEWKFEERHNIPTLHSKAFAAITSWKTSKNWGYSYTATSILADRTRSDADFQFFSGLRGEIHDVRKNEYIIRERSSGGSEPWSYLSEAIWLQDYLAGTIRSEYSKATRGVPYYEDNEESFRYGIDRTWWGNKTEEINLFIGYDKIFTKNGDVPIDNSGTTPIIVGSRTLLPIRAIVEVLGGSVEWNSGMQEIICRLNGHTVHLYIDSLTYYADYNSRSFDVAPMIYNNRTMVPARSVLEALGCSVDWVVNGGGDGWNMIVVSSPYYTTMVSP